jgi:hypothetical protein
MALCAIALPAGTRTHVVNSIGGHQTTHERHSFDPPPASSPQFSIAAPTAFAGPSTVHAPALTRASIDRPSLRWLPGASSRLTAPTRPAPHLVATPLLI